MLIIELTCPMPQAGGVTYTWDARGNLVGDGTFTYEYNGAGRLVGAESVTATVAYTYTASGLRVGQSVDGEETSYAWDWASGLPEMLNEGGNLYLVGQDTLARWDGASWTYHLPDALGSVRQEVAGAGWVTAAREWTPYGVELDGTQAGLGYTGEWWDAEAGLLYLRARWYSSRDGIFLSRDPIESEPPYQYVQGNPIDGTDPSGYFVNPSKVGYEYFYSCKCGWIDTDHAGSQRDLIKAVRDVGESAQEWVTLNPSLTQRDQDVAFIPFLTSASFRVRRGGVMGTDSADEVALGIFIAWENFFEEEGQGGDLLAGPASTFSEEDLVSDLIGFHRGLYEIQWELEKGDPASLEHFMDKCEVVGYDEYYKTDKRKFREIQGRIWEEYNTQNGWLGRHCQWGVRPPGRWSGQVPLIDPIPGVLSEYDPRPCSSYLRCDKQQEQLPSELVQVTPQSPGPDKNWVWLSGTVAREGIVVDDPNCYIGSPFCPYTRIVAAPFDVNELNSRPLNWAGP